MQTEQPHDEPIPDREHKNYFSAPRFYCVKTICAPCGVVIAWAKFPKAESPTNILAFLENVFQTEEYRPDYICIDKACLVLQTALRMDHGIGYGKRLHGLLLMLITTSTIEMMMNFARNGVILHQLMALHLIWLLKLKIKKEKLVSDVHSIHR
jgi:hypothetical protein